MKFYTIDFGDRSGCKPNAWGIQSQKLKKGSRGAQACLYHDSCLVIATLTSGTSRKDCVILNTQVCDNVSYQPEETLYLNDL